MNSIFSTGYYIHFQENAFQELNTFVLENNLTKIFVLVDTNTQNYCLPYFVAKFNEQIPIEVIQIKAGELHKNIDTCIYVWEQLTQLGADRKSLLINLGGGMVTDLGGFVASTFKRGIKFINIPTTLLSMVDASVGSKTGVDLGSLKNLIGLFSDPEMVLIDTAFLNTMPKRDLYSGLSEIIKYGLTYDKNLWNTIKASDDFTFTGLNNIIYRSVEIKNDVVLQDLKEGSLRKVLNFGHTIGHAIESYFLESTHKKSLTHGEAIGIGMISEAYISSELLGFSKDELNTIKAKIFNLFGHSKIYDNEYSTIIDLMKYDKKNIGNEVNFVLLKDLESFVVDCKVPNKLIIDALNYYNL